jgi:hypothetical protein
MGLAGSLAKIHWLFAESGENGIRDPEERTGKAMFFKGLEDVPPERLEHNPPHS